MEIIYIQCDNKVIEVNKFHFMFIQYFKTIFSNPSKYGHGTKENPIIVDIDCLTLRNIIEYLRNGDDFDLSDSDNYIFDILCKEETYVPSNDEFIKLNVSGKIYYSTPKTLCQLEYFEKMINTFNCKTTTYIDRNGKIFKHILSALRNPYHEIPKEFRYELLFYGEIKKSNVVGNLNRYNNLNNEYKRFNPYINLLSSGPLNSNNKTHTFFKQLNLNITNYCTNDVIIDPGTIENNIIEFVIGQEYCDLISGDFYLVFGDSESLLDMKSIKDIIVDAELIISKVPVDKITGDLIDFLIKYVYPIELDVFKKNLESNDVVIPLVFYNKNNYAQSIPMFITFFREIRIRVKMNDIIDLNKMMPQLLCESIILSSDERSLFYNAPQHYHVKLWSQIEYQFDKDEYYFEIKDKEYFTHIFFEIIPNDPIFAKIECLNSGYLKISDQEAKYISPIISRKNIMKHFNPNVLKNNKNIYMIHFNLSNVNNTQHNVSIFNHDKLSVNLKMKCSNGTVRFYLCKFNVLEFNNGNVKYLHD